MEKDGKNTESEKRLTPKNGTRPRSHTLDTNASINSLHWLSPNTLYETRTLTTDVPLDKRPSNPESRSIVGSITPKENCPLNN